MASRALIHEHRFAFFGQGVFCRRGVCLQLIGHPLREVGFAQRDRFHTHVGVRKTAELCALTRVQSWLISFDSVQVNTTRNRIAFTVQCRNPVRVNNVATGFTQQHFCPGRND